MKAFNNEQIPVAMVGQVLQLQPRERFREVQALEQLPLIGPEDYGPIAADGDATDDGASEIEIEALEMRQNHLAQVWVHPLSPVEIEVRQDGQQDTRFQTANRTAVITPDMDPQFTEIFVLGDNVPYFRISNPNSYELQTSRIAYSGFKYLLNDSNLSESEVSDRQPISIPIEKLERSTQRPGGRAAQSRDAGAGMSASRARRRP